MSRARTLSAAYPSLTALVTDQSALDALAEIRTMLVARGVGAVTEVGGVATGAIVESGSNANGAYVKFADGTAFIRMTGIENCAASGVHSTVVSTPISMIGSWRGALTISATEGTAGNVSWQAMDAYTETSVTVRFVRSTAGNTSFAILGFGRWY